MNPIFSIIVFLFVVSLLLCLCVFVDVRKHRRQFERNYQRIKDRIQGRATATNAVMVPMELDHRGSDNMFPDTGVVIAFRNALVALSTDDRHFKAASLQTDIPRGVILNDEVATGEANSVKKNIGVFGIYPGTLSGMASAPIPANADLVADPANPGQIIALPAAAGTYYVFGRARLAVVTAGDPVSIIHHVARKITQ